MYVADHGNVYDGSHIALRVQWDQANAADVYLDDEDALILVGAILSMVGRKDSAVKKSFKERVDELHKKYMEGGA